MDGALLTDLYQLTMLQAVAPSVSALAAAVDERIQAMAGRQASHGG